MQPNSYATVSQGVGIGPGTGAGLRGGLPEEKNVAQMVRENTTVYGRKFQAFLDRSTPHVLERWLVTLGLFILFALSIIFRQGVSALRHLGTDQHSGTLYATRLQSTFSTSSSLFCNPDSTHPSRMISLQMTSKKAHLVYPAPAIQNLKADSKGC